jgi:hypothetical protein
MGLTINDMARADYELARRQNPLAYYTVEQCSRDSIAEVFGRAAAERAIQHRDGAWTLDGWQLYFWSDPSCGADGVGVIGHDGQRAVTKRVYRPADIVGLCPLRGRLSDRAIQCLPMR